MSATRRITFRDPRPPQEIQFELERDLMVLLRPATLDGRLEFHGTAKVNGAGCAVALSFESALPGTNYYSLNFTMSWDGLPAITDAYYQNSSNGWFDLWTRHYEEAPLPRREANDPGRYEALVRQAEAAESSLDTSEAVQREILAALRAGGSFSTAHKEGGSTIRFLNGRFVRTDYGESSEREEFPGDAAFLAFLFKFYHWETSRNADAGPPSEYVRWKLILRLLRPSSPPWQGPDQSGPKRLHAGLAFLIALAAVGGLTLLRGGPSWTHRFSDLHPVQPPRAQLPSFDFPSLPAPPTLPISIKSGASGGGTNREHSPER